MEELWEVVRSIPAGRCASYGAVGRALASPLSGYEVGRRMADAPAGVPWWRVLAKDGSLPIHKRAPHYADEQRRLLDSEGVPVTNGRVDMEAFGYEPSEGGDAEAPTLF